MDSTKRRRHIMSNPDIVYFPKVDFQNASVQIVYFSNRPQVYNKNSARLYVNYSAVYNVHCTLYSVQYMIKAK